MKEKFKFQKKKYFYRFEQRISKYFTTRNINK